MSSASTDDRLARETSAGPNASLGVPKNAWTRSHIIVVATVLILFGWTATFPLLLWDDTALIVDNPHVRNPSLSSLLHIWTAPDVQIYMPVTYSLWMFEAIPAFAVPQLLSLDHSESFAAGIYHATTVFLFCLLALQVYELFRRFLADEGTCLIATLLFICHPAQVETVAWVSENKGLLCTLFSTMALSAYIDAINAGSTEQASKRRYRQATALFVLALLSKPTAVAVPLIAASIDWGFLRRPASRIAVSIAPWVVTAIVMMIVTLAVQHEGASQVATSLQDRPFIAFDAVTFYLRKLFVPLYLVPDYARNPASILQNTSAPVLWGSLAWLIIGLAVIFLASRGARRTTALSLWFLAALLPNLGFIPFAFQQTSTVADRYLTPALVPACLAIALWLDRRSPMTRYAMAVPIGLLAALSAVQTTYWQNDEHLANHELSLQPRSYVFWNNRSAYELLHGQFPDALRDATEALKLEPNHQMAHVNQAMALIATGREGEAISALERLLTIAPNNDQALDMLARLYQSQRSYAKALRTAEQRAPNENQDFDWQMRIARLMILSGETDAGIEKLESLLGESFSQNRRSLIVAQVFEQANEDREAAIRYRAIVDKLGNQASLAKQRLAWLHATSPDAEVRAQNEAVVMMQDLGTAMQNDGRVLPASYWDILAASLASEGKFKEAVAAATKGESIAILSGETELATEISNRRQLFEKGEPYINNPPPLFQLPASSR